MLYEGNESYYPLIPIGQNIKVGPGDNDTVSCLCLSPAGRVAFVERDPIQTGESDIAFLSRVSACSDLARSLTWDELNRMCESYYYKKEGQAFRIIDIMARAGCLQFADEGLLSIKADRGVKTDRHLVVIASDDCRGRQKVFSEGDFADSHLYFSFVGNNLPFM